MQSHGTKSLRQAFDTPDTQTLHIWRTSITVMLIQLKTLEVLPSRVPIQWLNYLATAYIFSSTNTRLKKNLVFISLYLSVWPPRCLSRKILGLKYIWCPVLWPECKMLSSAFSSSVTMLKWCSTARKESCVRPAEPGQDGSQQTTAEQHMITGWNVRLYPSDPLWLHSQKWQWLWKRGIQDRTGNKRKNRPKSYRVRRIWDKSQMREGGWMNSRTTVLWWNGDEEQLQLIGRAQMHFNGFHPATQNTHSHIKFHHTCAERQNEAHPAAMMLLASNDVIPFPGGWAARRSDWLRQTTGEQCWGITSIHMRVCVHKCDCSPMANTGRELLRPCPSVPVP